MRLHTPSSQRSSHRAEKNWKRHGVTQEECGQIFANLPLLLSVATRVASGESRYFASGEETVLREL